MGRRRIFDLHLRLRVGGELDPGWLRGSRSRWRPSRAGSNAGPWPQLRRQRPSRRRTLLLPPRPQRTRHLKPRSKLRIWVHTQYINTSHDGFIPNRSVKKETAFFPVKSRLQQKIRLRLYSTSGFVLIERGQRLPGQTSFWLVLASENDFRSYSF